MIPRWLWALFFLALSAPFWDLGHPAIEVDDARYVEVPREMVETGDWATPRLNYMDYVEKPPLWYWSAAVSYKIFGVSEAAARLPLAVLSLIGLLGTAWLGSWLYSERTGITAAILLSSSGMYFFLSHYITPDLPLTVFLLWTSGLILRTLLRPEDGRWAAPLAWAACGLAFLSKGLVALVFPMGWTSILLVLFPQTRQGFWKLLKPVGPLIFLAIAAPWFMLMQRRHPGFLHFFFTEQHFQRYLTQKYNRMSPWYFFLLVLPAGLLPWTPAVFAGLAQTARRWRDDAGSAALAIWAGMVLAFFSTSQSKLVTYLLPVFPHLALLAARALEEDIPVWCERMAWGLGAAFLAATLAPRFVPKIASELTAPTLKLAVAAAAALGASLLALGRRRNAWAIAGLGGFLAGGIALAALRADAEMISVRSLSQAIKERLRPGDEIYVYGIYLHGIPFYTRHRVDKVLNWIGELHYAKRDPASADRFGGEEEIAKLPLEGKSVFLVYRRFETPYVMSLAPADRIKEHLDFGKWELAVY